MENKGYMEDVLLLPVCEGDLVGFKPNTEKRLGMPRNSVGRIICWDDKELGYRLKWENPKDGVVREVTLEPGELLFLKELSDEAMDGLYGVTYTALKCPKPRKILDSGDRTEYSTGAVRDCKEGKGRCDLMPLDVVARFIGNTSKTDHVLELLGFFKESADVSCLYNAIGLFGAKGDDPFNVANRATQMLEVAKHFEEGAKKYGPNNWQKGIPVHSYIDSAVRHYLKYRAGWTDENHDRAFVWNLMCCIWTMKHHPELDDFTEKKEAAGNE